mgnify:CR=1 FL=1
MIWNTCRYLSELYIICLIYHTINAYHIKLIYDTMYKLIRKFVLCSPFPTITWSAARLLRMWGGAGLKVAEGVSWRDDELSWWVNVLRCRAMVRALLPFEKWMNLSINPRKLPIFYRSFSNRSEAPVMVTIGRWADTHENITKRYYLPKIFHPNISQYSKRNKHNEGISLDKHRVEKDQ